MKRRVAHVACPVVVQALLLLGGCIGDGDGSIDSPERDEETPPVASVADEVSACTHYASPAGTGDGLSTSKSFKVKDFWAVASPGKVLCLMDGTYTGPNSMIDPPDYLSGASGKPITVRALNDGKATIDGQFARVPIRLRYNDYFVIEGLNAHGSSGGSVVLVSASDNNIVRRVIAWDAKPDENAMVFACNYGSDNLFEDVAGWGNGRKVFGLYGDTRTTWRRGYFRWTNHETTVWKVGHTSSYYSHDTTTENTIGTWDRASTSDTAQQAAIFGTDHAEKSFGTHKFFGNIAYHLNAQKPSSGSDVAWTMTVGGYCKGPPERQANMNYGDLLSFRGTAVATKGMLIGCNSQGAHTTDVSGSTIVTEGGAKTVGQLGGDLLQFKAQARPSTGAWLRYRYVNGKLTNQPLWPWPMNARIKAAMSQSGYAAKGGLDGNGETDLTKLIFKLAGATPPPAEGGGGSGGGGGGSTSCTAKYGAQSGFQLCFETPAECGFEAIKNHVQSCAEICSAAGGQCLRVLGNSSTAPCTAVGASSDDCSAKSHYDDICVCSR